MTSPPSPNLRRAAHRAQRTARRSEGRRRRRARRSIFWRWRRAMYVAVLLAIAAVAGAIAAMSRVQLTEADPLAQTTYVCAADVSTDCGPTNALASFRAEVDRQVVGYDEIPAVVIEAVLAAEDRDFFRHGGVDPLSVARAVVRDVRGQGSLQGGSTITQQYVKNAFLNQDRTLARKLKEAVLAVKLERKLSKQEILTRYLNTIYFGRGAYGVQAASFAYFGGGLTTLAGGSPLSATPSGVVDADRATGSGLAPTGTSDRTNLQGASDTGPGPAGTASSADAVRLAKAAYLAGLIRSPETADATLDPSEAEFRRSSVLDGMVATGAITVEQAAAAKAVPFTSFVAKRTEHSGLGVLRGNETGSAYFVEAVRQWLLAHFNGDAQRVFAGGLRVYTTLRYDLQEQAYRAIYDPDQGALPDPADPAGSLVAVDEAGRVVALVGGRDFATSQVNLALGAAGGGSGRQPGSTFKPFALAAAIEGGLSPLSTFPAPDKIVFPGANDGEDWSVSGGGSDTGRYNLLDALAQSSNTVYSQLMVQLGAAKVVALAHDLGVSAELPAVPALVLGSGEVSVLDMASAYSTFANRGSHVEPVLVTRITDSEGHVLYSSRYEPRNVVKVATADAVTTAMREVISSGTGTRAAIERDAAGKTGTTEDYRDAWFVGYTCTGPSSNLTAAVWMGYSGQAGQPVASMVDVRGVHNVGGGTFPARIWSTFMANATEGTPECQLPVSTKFPGERRDVKEVTNASVPPGALRTTTTASTTTTATTSAPSQATPSSASSGPTPNRPGSPATSPATTTAPAGPPGPTASSTTAPTASVATSPATTQTRNGDGGPAPPSTAA